MCARVLLHPCSTADTHAGWCEVQGNVQRGRLACGNAQALQRQEAGEPSPTHIPPKVTGRFRSYERPLSQFVASAGHELPALRLPSQGVGGDRSASGDRRTARRPTPAGSRYWGQSTPPHQFCPSKVCHLRPRRVTSAPGVKCPTAQVLTMQLIQTS